MSQTQAMTLAASLPPAKAPDGQSPLVIIPSALELTLEQEKRLMVHAKQRFDELSKELGRHDYEASGYLQTPTAALRTSCSSHLGKRHLSHLIFSQQMEWRSYLLGGLYKESNVHLPITTRAVGQQIARANKSFFGTSPFFSVSGLSAEDEEFARDVNSYARLQLDTLGGISANLQAAVELAFIQGETAVKTKRVKLTSYFESYRVIALDDQKQPIIALDGDYIYKTDLFIEEEAPVLDKDGLQVPGEDGAPQMQVTGRMVLKRDLKTLKPDYMDFQNVKIHLAQLLTDRVEARPIYFLDFLCPLNAADVQSADCVVHLYDSQVIQMADQFLRDAWGDTPPKDQLERISDLVHRMLPGTGDDKTSLADRPRPDQGELAGQGIGKDSNEPLVGLAELWLWFDPFGDGVQRSIMLLMDQGGRLPIHYDYAANLTEDGLRPIDVVRINPVVGRWHGRGNVERNYSLQSQADLLLNRALYLESRAGRIDFWKPANTIEGDANPNLKLNWGGTYRLKEGKTLADTLQSVFLQNTKHANLKDLLELILQMSQAMSAVQNVNDGAMAGLDTQKLATGIKNLERSGEEMFGQWISHLAPDLEKILRRALKCLLSNFSKVGEAGKLMRFFDRMNNRMVEIDPYRMKDLDLDIVLDLTTYKSQAQLQSGQLAYTTMKDFLATIMAPPEEMEKKLGTIMEQILRALEFKNAKELCAPIQRALPAPVTLPAQTAGTPTAGVGQPEAAI